MRPTGWRLRRATGVALRQCEQTALVRGLVCCQAPATAKKGLPRPSQATLSGHDAHSRRWFWSRQPRPQLLGIEGLEGPKDFPRLAREAVDEAKRKLAGASEKSAEELVTALDDASNVLCRIADAAELIRNVHPDQKYVAQASEAVQEVAAYMGDVNLDRGMYDGLHAAEHGPTFGSLSAEAQSVLQHMRVSMAHEGVHLPDAEKEICLQLLEHEQHLSFEIVQQQERLRRSEGTDGSGAWVPRGHVAEALGGALKQLPSRKDGVDEEIFIPSDSIFADQVMKASQFADTRQAVYEAQQVSDEEGANAMASLLQARQQLAQLRGYSTWNDYAQREALLSTPSRVDSFLGAAWERLKPGFEADLRSMAAEQLRFGLGPGRLRPWDVPLLLHRCRQEHLQEESKVSEYLTYGSLMNGVKLISSDLLGIGFRQAEPANGEVWHPSVQKYELHDGDHMLGIMYLDPFMRPGKMVQSAQFTLQGSKTLPGGGRQVPMTSLVFSLPVGDAGLPLSYAITFMHEIGHAMHSLLSQTTFQHLSGTRGTVDFVEFPSHLFEHFVLDPSCLASYAVHAKTRTAMPMEVQQICRKGRLRFAHFEAMQQLMYAVVDQAFYSYCPSIGKDADASSASEGVRQHLASALARFDAELEGGPFEGPATALLGLSRPSKFDHLIHYGGSYYCYLFNRALSAHIWQNSFQEDPFAAGHGERLRSLLQGGSVVQTLEPIEALLPRGAARFRAEDVPFDAFVQQLSIA